jgi:uncharacterized protein YodC (DUF2158 family)
MDINPGDTVSLKSGGPAMSVQWIEYGTAYCIWFDAKMTKQDGKFKVESLVKGE